MYTWQLAGFLIFVLIYISFFTFIMKVCGMKAAMLAFGGMVLLALILYLVTGLITYGDPCFVWVPLGYENACQERFDELLLQLD